MINHRLTQYLEQHKLLSPIQCRFRRAHATIDHLIRLDTHIRKGFLSECTTVGVFFDLQKAYDTAWRYGILQDMHQMGLRGRLPRYIEHFLSNRGFRVNVNNQLSNEYRQEAGVSQGSILSVTLFAIKINSITEAIPQYIHSSLFVDDLQISVSAHNMQTAETQLQPVINNLAQWTDKNGFNFSTDKTCCMAFHKRLSCPALPNLRLYKSRIPCKQTVKFLGLHWDPQLSWKWHIAQLKISCNTAFNLMKTMSAREWGADQFTLLHIYRLLIRPKIDYGSIVYGAATPHILKAVDTIHNDALRLCAGAFKSTPVQCLYILLNEPSLQDRRQTLLCRYYYKSKCHILNPAYNCIINQRLEQSFSNHQLLSKPVIIRTKEAVQALGVQAQPVLPYKTPSFFSWEMERPNIDTAFTKIDIKGVPRVADIFFDYVATEYANYKHIYTDGSKTDNGVGAAAILGQTSKTATLPQTASVYTAEMHALQMACHIIHEQRETQSPRYLICTYSLSAVKGLKALEPKKHFMLWLQLKFHSILQLNNKVTVIWIPGYSGIPGNEIVD